MPKRSMRDVRRGAAALLSSVALGLTGMAAFSVVTATAAAADTPGPVPGYDYSKAIQPLAGCETNELTANDDGSAGPTDIGFPINFFGETYSQVYVNNNGNVTFTGAQATYRPFPLEDATSVPIIAPYFTDIDTRYPDASRTVHYGTGLTSTGQKYFCVDWIQVAQYSAGTSQGVLSFQLVLSDASGQPGANDGDFDIEFNYDDMPWDHGGVRAGFAAGTGVEGTSLELPPGTGEAGKMINGGDNALVNSSANSTQLGRYRYPIRGNGQIPTGEFTGTVTSSSDGSPVSGARVQACRVENTFCRTAVSGDDGTYTVSNLRGGDYTLLANPPTNSGNPGRGEGTLTSNTDSQVVNLQIETPQAPPNGTTIPSQNGTTVVDGVEVPIIYWGQAHPFSFNGCVGASPAQVRFDGFYNDGTPYTSTVTAVEDPSTPGRYNATIPEFDTLGVHGNMTIHELLTCPGQTDPSDVSFTIYIDPSGTILDQNGDPVSGATVTLLTSDTVDGTYEPVPDGSNVMSPSNRTNPDTTGDDGQYAWDVTAGFYKVRAAKAGCTGPGGTAYVESAALTIPPAVTGLDLTLNCATTPVNQPPTVSAGTDVSGVVGTAIALSGSANDPDSDPLTLTWSVNSPNCMFTDEHTASTTITCTVSGDYVATLTADDDVNAPVSDDATVTVTNDTGTATCRGLSTTPGVTKVTNPSTGVTTFTGTSGNDVIVGTSGNDVIRALAGNDVVCAGTGNDTVLGGTGNDVLRGQSGNDKVQGQSGTDTVQGNDGNDNVQGNDDNDRVLGGIGNDKVIGGRQTDYCNGGAGTDTSTSCETLVGFP